jgi:thymidylate synthase
MADEEYKKLVKEILGNRKIRPDRTGTGTISMFGGKMIFDLAIGFPLLTVKRVFFRGVVEELLWFFRGSTNANELKDVGVNIWNDHSSRKFLDSRGFYDREEGEVGPMYGFQWRNWGANYPSKSGGIDQINILLSGIKNDPFSRRHILSSWNVADLPEMSLSPCHVLAQFYVDGEKNNYTLSCQVYQRSADMGLGIPFNIASYALLVEIFCHMLGMKAGKLHYIIGDAHIYSDHIEAMEKICEDDSSNLSPKLRIKCSPKNKVEEYSVGDFEVVDYSPKNSVKMKMAI